MRRSVAGPSEVSCAERTFCWVPFARRRRLASLDNVYSVETSTIIRRKISVDRQPSSQSDRTTVRRERYSKTNIENDSVTRLLLVDAEQRAKKYHRFAPHSRYWRDSLSKSDCRGQATSSRVVDRLERNNESENDVLRQYFDNDDHSFVLMSQVSVASENTAASSRAESCSLSSTIPSRKLQKTEDYEHIKNALRLMSAGMQFSKEGNTNDGESRLIFARWNAQNSHTRDACLFYVPIENSAPVRNAFAFQALSVNRGAKFSPRLVYYVLIVCWHEITRFLCISSLNINNRARMFPQSRIDSAFSLSLIMSLFTDDCSASRCWYSNLCVPISGCNLRSRQVFSIPFQGPPAHVYQRVILSRYQLSPIIKKKRPISRKDFAPRNLNFQLQKFRINFFFITKRHDPETLFSSNKYRFSLLFYPIIKLYE